ncbi:TPA: hypothetical protein DDW35_11520 [Candidatus Sumerlaeota bacterium]|jgi:hypothetical protein|nr:hypothetical protein [Candidatus Sumerlaeota bacterium]
MSGLDISLSTNADDAAQEIAKEKAECDGIMAAKIKRGCIATFARMIRIAPRLTGNYRANMYLSLLENPKTYRITGRRAGLPKELLGYRGHNESRLALIRPHYEAIEKQHIAEASAAFSGKNLNAIRHVTIYNDAPHAHLVESGGTRNKAHWVFLRGQAMAESALNGD